MLEDDVDINSQNFTDFLYYDYYQQLDKNTIEDDEKEPDSMMAWVHFLAVCGT